MPSEDLITSTPTPLPNKPGVPKWKIRKQRRAAERAARLAAQRAAQAAADKKNGIRRKPGGIEVVGGFGDALASQRAAARARQQARLARQMALRARTKALQDKYAARARQEAFKALKAKNEVILRSVADKYRLDMQQRQQGILSDRAELARQKREIEKRIVSQFGGGGRGLPSVAESIDRARKNGWGSELKKVEKQTKDTGGRYVDQEKFDALTKGFMDDAKRNRAQMALWNGRVMKAINNGNIEKARRLFNKPAFVNVRDEFIRINGDGRKPGEAQAIAKTWKSIARQNDAWRSKFLAGTDLSADEAALKRDMALVESMRNEPRWVPAPDKYGKNEGEWVNHRLTDDELQEKFSKIQEDFMKSDEMYKTIGNLAVLLPGASGWGQRPIKSVLSMPATNVSHPGFTFDENPLIRIKRGAGTDFDKLRQQFEGGTTVQKNAALMDLFFAGQNDWLKQNPDGGPVLPPTAPALPTEVGGFKRPPEDDDARWIERLQSLYRAGDITLEQYQAATKGNALVGTYYPTDNSKWKEQKERADNALWMYLTGTPKAPGNLEQFMLRSLKVPIFGDLLRAIQIPVGSVFAMARMLGNQVSGGGRLSVPNVEFANMLATMMGEGDKPWITHPGETIGPDVPFLNPLVSAGIRFDKSAEAMAKEKADFDGMKQDVFSYLVNGDLSGAMDTVANYGNDALQGNTSFLYYTVGDPTTYLPAVGTVLKSGRAAITRAGGALAAIKDIDSTLIDFYKLVGPSGGYKAMLLPKSAQGYGWKGGLGEFEAVNKFNKILGTNFKTIDEFISSKPAEFVRDFLENKNNPVAMRNLIERTFGTVPVDSKQLMVAVQQAAEEMAQHMGLTVTSAFDVEKLLIKQERALARKTRELPALMAESRRVKSIETAADAAERIRLERRAKGASNVASKVKSVATGKSKHDIILIQREVDAKIAEWVARVDDAARAAKVLRENTGQTLGDIAIRREAIDKLRVAMDDVDRLGAPGGDLAIYRDAVFQNAGVTGVAHHADHFDSTIVQITEDLNYVRGQMTLARARLKAGHAGANKRVRLLGAAERYYRAEIVRLKGAKAIREEVVKAHAPAAKAAINPNRIAVAIRSKGDLVEEASRDLYRRLRGATLDPSDTRADVNGAEATDLYDAQTILASVPVDTRSGPLVQHAMDIGGMQLMDAMAVFYPLYKKNPGKYGSAWAELNRQFEFAMHRMAPGKPATYAPGPGAAPSPGLGAAPVSPVLQPYVVHYSQASTVFSNPVYHGTRNTTPESMIGRSGVLAIRSTTNLGQTGVSLTDDLDTALDYATRIPASGGRRGYDRWIIVVDGDALRRSGVELEQEASRELFFRASRSEVDDSVDPFDVGPEDVDPEFDPLVLPAGSWRLVQTPAPASVSPPPMTPAQQYAAGITPSTWANAGPSAPSGPTILTPATHKLSHTNAEKIMDTENRMHLGGLIPMSMDDYEKLDNMIQAESLAIFGKKSGVTKFVQRRSPGGNILRVRDEEMQFLVRKYQVLKDNGYTVSEYDEAGQVFRNPMLRRQTSKNLSITAHNIVKATGRDFHEVFLEVRDAFMDQEAERQLGRFIEKNWSEGMTSEDVFTLFEQMHLENDLLPTATTPMTRYQLEILGREFKNVSGVTDINDLSQVKKILNKQHGTDKMTRPQFREWLETSGRWAPRTADQIKNGKRVWSIEEEAKHYEHNFGFVPEWADPKVIAKILDDPQVYKAFFEKHGYYDDGFEMQLAGLKISVDEQRRVMIFGDAATGAKRGRTQEELRSWAAQRYGSLVSDDGGKTLKSMPQLMDPSKAEYTDWLVRQVKGGRVIDPTLVSPKQLEGFSKAITEAVARRLERFAKDGYLEHGEEWLPEEQLMFAMDTVDELRANPEWRGFFKGAPGRYGLYKFGWLMRANILLNPAFNVMNIIELLGVKPFLLAVANGGMKMAKPPSAAARKAFPNLAALSLEYKSVWKMGDRSGLSIVRDGYLKPSTRAKAILRVPFEAPAEVAGSLEDRLKLGFAQRLFDEIHPELIAAGMSDELAEAMTLRLVRDRVLKFFPSMDEASELEKALNQLIPFFSYNFRNKVLGLNIALNHPWLLNLAGNIGDVVEEANREAWLRDHPGEPVPSENDLRTLWLQSGDDILKVDLTTYSDWFRGPKAIFGDIGENGTTLPDLIKTFVRVPHPQQNIMLAWLQGHEKSSDGIDATFENWFFPADIAKSFGAALAADGDMTPWIQMFSKILFFKEFKVLDPMQPKIDIYFTLLAAGRDADAKAYLADNPGIQDWFAEHSADDKFRVQWDDAPNTGFFTIHKKEPELIKQYKAQRQELDDLILRWDRQLEAIFDQPWAAEYKRIKENRRLAISSYIASHPLITDARVSYMTPQDWFKQLDDWAVDASVDEYFKQVEDRAPKRTDFKTDLEYAEASVAFGKWRREFLAANPKVSERLAKGFTDVETAWRAQETQWSTILEENGRYMVRILKEQAKPHPNSKLISILYDKRELNYLLLNAEGYVDVSPGLRNRALVNEGIQDAKGTAGQIAAKALSRFYNSSPKERVTLPGFSDFLYERADDETQARMRSEEWLSNKLSDIVGRGDPKHFYDRLRQSPRVLREYLKQNPDKRDDVRYAFRIGDLFDRSSSGAEFYRGLDSDPWLRRRYFEAHPEARSAYEVSKRYYVGITRIWEAASKSSDFGETWGRLLARDPWLARQYALRHPGSGGSAGDSKYFTAITALYRRAKNSGDFGEAWSEGLRDDPWLRAQYFARNPGKKAAYQANGLYSKHMGHWVSLLQSGDYDAARRYYDSMPSWVRSRYETNNPKGEKFKGDSEYHGYMEGWVKLLEKGDYAAADKFFKSMPLSVQEKYFSTHEDDRAKMQLTSEQLATMSQYWLMPDDDPARLEWASKHPGLMKWMQANADDEYKRRALIMQLYRSVSKEDAWIRRRLSERYPEIFSTEAVGQHKIDNVMEKLAEHPEMIPYYEKMVTYLSEAYENQLHHSNVPPRPITFERLNKYEVKRKRRYIAMSQRNRRHLRLSA